MAQGNHDGLKQRATRKNETPLVQVNAPGVVREEEESSRRDDFSKYDYDREGGAKSVLNSTYLAPPIPRKSSVHVSGDGTRGRNEQEVSQQHWYEDIREGSAEDQTRKDIPSSED